MKKLIDKIKDKRAYNRIVRVAKKREKDTFHNRHVVDLDKGFLFYFPETGKITTTLKGLVFRSKNECWYSRKELNELLNQIEKELFYMVIYYLYSLKEVNFGDFNKILTATYGNLTILSATLHGACGSKFTYYPSIEFIQKGSEEEKKLSELYDEIIYTFGDMYTEKEIQGHEYIKPNSFNQAIEFVKKYS